jgi:hypothetical protein
VEPAEIDVEPVADATIVAPAPDAESAAADDVPKPRKPPLYWRLLRLRHVHPNGWQRALLIEGVLAVAVVLVLAGKATIWTLLVLPVVAAVLVKLNDVLAGSLAGRATATDVAATDDDRSDPDPDPGPAAEEQPEAAEAPKQKRRARRSKSENA